jgi:deoxyribonuclease-4
VDRAPANARKLRASAIQIFTRNQRQWTARPIPAATAAAFRDQMASSGVAFAMSHASYLLNLAGHGQVLKRSREALLDEWDRAERLGLRGVCFHPGAHLGAGEERGLDRVAESLNAVEARRPGHQSRLLIENTAGQGTCLGRRFEELAAILAGLRHPERFGLCIDTCHLFAAGYDLRGRTGYCECFEDLERRVGLERLAAFHLNDSKGDLGSRVDRHAGIGQGKLGRDPFRWLLEDARFRDLPKILETPGGDEGYRRELQMLRRMAP